MKWTAPLTGVLHCPVCWQDVLVRVTDDGKLSGYQRCEPCQVSFRLAPATAVLQAAIQHGVIAPEDPAAADLQEAVREALNGGR